MSSTDSAPSAMAAVSWTRSPFAALDWRPGTSLELTCLDAGVLLARPTSDGAIVITAGGYFRIPYRLRRQASLFIGKRALLIGHRTHNRLLNYPPAMTSLTASAASAETVAAARLLLTQMGISPADLVTLAPRSRASVR
ncbi:hypothetical protein [Nocardia abscessus]|uniref:hypothetical protein n=1 Tax=Nocardia abscessus TaxID=120957 RepID=UPI002453C611|nr:hypothetical protein [Nocardia abscessus]